MRQHNMNGKKADDAKIISRVYCCMRLIFSTSLPEYIIIRFESSHFSEHIFSPETVFVARRVFAMSKPICGCTYGTCSVRRRNAPRKDIPSRSVRKTRCGR